MAIRKRFKKNYPETPKPTETIWGTVQTAITFGPGIWQVTTASHGGILLSPERNEDVPKYMRDPAGAYEEDTEWCIPVLVFPDEFRKDQKPERYEAARNTLLQYYPRDYERFFDCEVAPGQSRVRDEELWKKTITNKYVVQSFYNDDYAFVPEGFVGAKAILGLDFKLEHYRWFLIPKTDYDTKMGPYGFVLEPGHGYEEIAEPTGDMLAYKSGQTVTPEKVVNRRTVKIELLLEIIDRPDTKAMISGWKDSLDLQEGERFTTLTVTEL